MLPWSTLVRKHGRSNWTSRKLSSKFSKSKCCSVDIVPFITRNFPQTSFWRISEMTPCFKLPFVFAAECIPASSYSAISCALWLLLDFVVLAADIRCYGQLLAGEALEAVRGGIFCYKFCRWWTWARPGPFFRGSVPMPVARVSSGCQAPLPSQLAGVEQ